MRRKRIKISPFLSKLYDIVSSEENRKVIKWNDTGDGFQIVNFPVFCNELLPQYFKHNNFASFVRQLNMYDFHKKKSSASLQEFENVNFVKGKNNLLKDIKRKVLIDSEKEYYQPYKRIRKTEEKERVSSQPTEVSKNEAQFNDDLEKANSNVKHIEDYCHEILNQNKRQREEIKQMKDKEKKEEKFLFDFIGNFEGVEYDSFRKKKLTNKKTLLVDMFNKINRNSSPHSSLEFNQVFKQLYAKNERGALRDNNYKESDCEDMIAKSVELQKRFREGVDGLVLKKKLKREADNQTSFD